MKMIQLHNMDCMEALREMPDKAFDLAIVDPPYGISSCWAKNRKSPHYKHRKKWNELIPDAYYFAELFRVSQNQIIWGGNYFTQHLSPTNSWIFWDKKRSVEKTFMSEGELAWTSFPIPTRKVTIQWDGGKKGTETGTRSIHPCQRPIALHKWTLEKYAKLGDKILDTHLGSGSIAIACHDMGYDLAGYEIDKEYYDAAVKRLREHQAQLKLF